MYASAVSVVWDVLCGLCLMCARECCVCMCMCVCVCVCDCVAVFHWLACIHLHIHHTFCVLFILWDLLQIADTLKKKLSSRAERNELLQLNILPGT